MFCVGTEKIDPSTGHHAGVERRDKQRVLEGTRTVWVEQVAAWTYAARKARAERHAGIADQCRSDAERLLRASKVELTDAWGTRETSAEYVALRMGYPSAWEARSALFRRATWHDRRARGLMHLEQRVRDCQQTDTFTLACPSCGQVDDDSAEERPVRCATWRYCISCRGKRCSDARKRFEATQAHWRKEFHREINGKYGAWGEKFLTLTTPHSGNAANDVAVVHQAWRVFSRSLRKWIEKHDARARRKNSPGQKRPSIPYVRVLEVTRSDDGHAHIHAWLLAPFVPHYVLRVLWGKALAGTRNVGTGAAGFPVQPLGSVIAQCEADAKTEWRRSRVEPQLRAIAKWARGKPMAYVPWPIIDVRKADDCAAELVKYLTKDLGPSGELMDPLEYANIVEACEGRRMMCASRHLWLERPKRSCPCCAVNWQRLTIHQRRAASRGPPHFRSYQES